MTQSHTWKTESLRLSLLGIADGSKLSWKSIVGHEPESQTSRPAQSVTIEEGPFEGGKLTVTSQPGRLDVTLSAIPVDPMSSPTLGKFEEVSKNFEYHVSRIRLPAATRLAMGATMHVFVGDLRESAELFKTLVGIDFGPDASDLSVQVNRPKKFPKIGGLVMNRLSKWSQLVHQSIQYQVGDAVTATQEHVIQLELDFNTHPQSKLPHPDGYANIISPFFSEARLLIGDDANG
ncbi:hypothetical protein [Pseudomonas lactucae]|uniref:hypothetical protein n=1 Tax=Pseudomonas lactucae TaxID=2813360 RepID=UPI002FCD051F